LEGALAAIRFARENNVPLGGACAGFQHVVLEYARNVLKYEDAVHAEYDPPPGGRVILDRLVCRVAGEALPIKLATDSLVAKIYGRDRIVERYYCQFGLNPEYRHRLGDLRVSGWDENDEARVVELPSHRFFLASLFVPQSSAGVHPIAEAFLKAAQQTQEAGSKPNFSERAEPLQRFRRASPDGW
jgi:CTP synthase (UTP-ammonia lyase)